MRIPSLCAIVALTVGPSVSGAQSHLNPNVDLLAAQQPLFGLYAPANPRGGRGGRGGAAGAAAPMPTPPTPPKTPAELAKDALAHAPNDFIFDGSMEGDFDRAFASYGEFVSGYASTAAPAARWQHPLIVKTHKIAEDPKLAAERIGRQLNLGVSTIMFVETESAAEVQAGLNAMRFASKGGTRPEADVGGAPALWGLTERGYRDRADLWPLNPRGELINWTIVESKEGLAHLREIAAVKGIGVLWPGAGTLRGVFTNTDANGQRVFDEKGWEDAIQQVLAACKEFHVPCGFPANTPEVMELRYKQGFRVFVSSWGDNGFKTVEAGLKLSGRTK